MGDEEVGKGENISVLVPGSGDVSFCGVVLNMTLRRGNPGYDHEHLGSAPLGVR
jgi:hypothetical protein